MRTTPTMIDVTLEEIATIVRTLDLSDFDQQVVARTFAARLGLNADEKTRFMALSVAANLTGSA